jgi:hypothetical protein
MLGRVQEDLQQVLNSSSEGSEDQEDPEHEQFEKAQNHVMQPFAGNFDDSKLDGMTFFRHPVSRVIHITSDESGSLFKCGRDINRVYINLGGQAYEPLIRGCRKGKRDGS